jgi:release factor glutamine methyltransferase
MQIAELIRLGRQELGDAGVEDGLSDVHLLLCHCLGKRRTELLLAAREEVDQQLIDCFLQLLDRRKRREPLAYILGEQEFWSRSFTVSPAVLIPRPETEFLIETVLTAVKARPHLAEGSIIDLCCGSGVIAIILALELGRPVLALDLSAKALDIAHHNCRRHGVEHLVRLVQGDLLAAIGQQGMVSLLVSNPPYVSRGAIVHEVAPEVREYEPWLALDGGENGLDAIRRIREALPPVLGARGEVFMEIGHDQGASVTALFAQVGSGGDLFTTLRILKDYAGRDRVLHGARG